MSKNVIERMNFGIVGAGGRGGRFRAGMPNPFLQSAQPRYGRREQELVRIHPALDVASQATCGIAYNTSFISTTEMRPLCHVLPRR